MIQGDPGIEDIYYWGPEGPHVSTRGRTGMLPALYMLPAKQFESKAACHLSVKQIAQPGMVTGGEGQSERP